MLEEAAAPTTRTRVWRALHGPYDATPGAVLVRWLFLRLLALVYLCAFVSLWLQVEGLIGEGGILPAQDLLSREADARGVRWLHRPTVFWLGASDVALHLGCAAGVLFSSLLLVNLAPALSLAALWLLYLSFFHVAQVFLAFQWDLLLLEVGFSAIFLAPWRLRASLDEEPPPSAWALWAGRVLALRLMFSSGVVKLLSRDATWSELRALDVHFETQPLPTWTAWYAHHLPEALLHFSVVMVFVIQLALPVLGLGPRRVRLVAFFGLAALQILIAATGNYTFFNLLALALCVLLLDDAFLRPVMQRVWPRLVERSTGERPPARRWQGRLVASVCATLLVLHAVQLTTTMGGAGYLPDAVRSLKGRHLDRFRVVNGYGLFARMTTTRPEIVIEGSHDGVTWLPYELPAKPGALDRAPPFVAPHQPRLDWQLWFAALSHVRRVPWVPRLLARLLEGNAEVEALFATVPFEDEPPRYARALLYHYRFTSVAERAATGRWWTRELVGQYAGPYERRGP